MTNFNVLSHLPQLIGWSAAGLGALTALVSASFLLNALNTLANLIRFIVWFLVNSWRLLAWFTPRAIDWTWNASQISGRFLWPHLHRLHEALIDLNDLINWIEVRTVFLECAAVILSAAVAAVTLVYSRIRTGVPAAYAWIERNFIDIADEQDTKAIEITIPTPVIDARTA